MDCHAAQKVYATRKSWLYCSTLALSAFSTLFSGAYLFAAFYQPRWGRSIASMDGSLDPSTASTISSLGARLIEMSFVTVFVAIIGQLFTRKAFTKGSKGVTLAELTMRNWVLVSVLDNSGRISGKHAG